MAVSCQVCSQEQAKYRCPACGVQSCSLACSKSHKTTCSPVIPDPVTSEDHLQGGSDGNALPKYDSQLRPAEDITAAVNNAQPTAVSGHGNTKEGFSSLESSPELQELWSRFPGFRSRLREIYNLTLEEEWVEEAKPDSHGWGRGRGRGRGRGTHSSRGGGRSRGPWTPEKGFNRGLGKVRKWREACDDDSASRRATGADDEAFRRFIALVIDMDTTGTG
ncbi:hypothetical protein MferCBS31731_007750 [Microsporum ferrugineum]